MFSHYINRLSRNDNFKTFHTETPYGNFKFQSNQLSDEKIKEYQERFSKVESHEAFNTLCVEIQKENNLIFEDFLSWSQDMFETLLKPLSVGSFLKFNPSVNDIDHAILKLQNLRKEVEKNDELKLIEKQRNEKLQNIKDLKNKLNEQGQLLIQNLDDEDKRNQINNEMLNINNQIKQIKQDLDNLK